MKILVAGGHPTPAFAVIEKLEKKIDKRNIVFIGRKYTLDSERTLSFEFKTCLEKHIRFRELKAGRMTRLISPSSLLSIVRVPIGFIYALQCIIEERPDVLVSFGGFIALPLVFWSWIARKKIITHEQTVRPGLANKLIAYCSTAVYVSFEETIRFFPRKKTKWIGNPVRECVFEPKKPSFWFDKKNPVIYITGGSLGSHSINTHIFALLEKITQQFTIVHQTGDVREYNDYEKALKMKKKLPPMQRKNYFPMKYTAENDIGFIYQSADLVVGRSGANTFFELLALQIPGLFIPLPWSANGEQKEHALFFVRNGIGELFDQKESSSKLFRLIQQMIKGHSVYKSHFSSLPFELKQNAAEILASNILS